MRGHWMMSVWGLMTAFAWTVPWVIVALAALFALWRKKRSTALVLQIVGAFGAAMMESGQVVGTTILSALGARYDVVHSARLVMVSLTWVALAVFVVGYVWEKVGRRGS